MTTSIVTGGAGFIGSHLCEALLKQGYKVVNIDSFNDFYDPLVKKRNTDETLSFIKRSNIDCTNYIVETGDIRDSDFLNSIFNKYRADLVVHLAAYAGVRPSIKNPILYNDVNTNGTVNMLEMCVKYGIKSFVFASSSSVYGNNKKIPFSEGDTVDFPVSPYAATKKAGELLCHTYHSLYDINMACLRFFTVYGPRQRPDLAIYKFTKLISEGKSIPFYGDGTTQRDYTYIEDIIDGVMKSIDWVLQGKQKYEILNLGESYAVSLCTMVETIERVLGKKAIIEELPMQPGDVFRTFADISKSKRVIGYNPVIKFEQGIKKFMEWYIQVNKKGV